MATNLDLTDMGSESPADDLSGPQGHLIDPEGRVVPLDDADRLIDAFAEAKEICDAWYGFRRQVQEAIALLADGDTKTRRVRGRRRRAKVTMPSDSWDQPQLKEVYNSYPKYRDAVLKIGTINVGLREYGKVCNESGPPDFETFKRMLQSANRGPQGTPSVTVEE